MAASAARRPEVAMMVMADKSAEEGQRWQRRAGAWAPARSGLNLRAFQTFPVFRAFRPSWQRPFWPQASWRGPLLW